jgi:DNA-directed RNA polymerase specialized sigma24 family protein
MIGPSHQVTGLLLAWVKGDEAALNQLVPLVHDELRRIARRCMAGQRAGHSLQATALVNEAYLRMIDVQHVNWQNRAHFLAMSARLMRRILVDIARSKRTQKRGGGAVRGAVMCQTGAPGGFSGSDCWRGTRCQARTYWQANPRFDCHVATMAGANWSCVVPLR